MGFVKTTGVLGEDVEIFSVYTRFEMGGLAKLMLRCRAIFFIRFSRFGIIYYDFHHLGNYLKCVCPYNPTEYLLRVHVTSGLYEKFFSQVFSEKISRKHDFLGRFFVSRFVFLYFTSSCHFLNLAFLRRRLLISDWLSLTFEMRKFSFSAKIL